MFQFKKHLVLFLTVLSTLFSANAYTVYRGGGKQMSSRSAFRKCHSSGSRITSKKKASKKTNQTKTKTRPVRVGEGNIRKFYNEGK